MTTRTFRLTAASGRGQKLKQFEEIIFPDNGSIDPQLGMQYVKEFTFRAGDIVQCTYPKSRTHWMGNMLWKLKTLDETDRAKDNFIEFAPNEFFDVQVEPRIIYTHQKPSRLDPERIVGKGKVVLMLRSPKDIAVSFFHHIKNAKLIKNIHTWNEFFQSFIDGQMMMGSVFTYLKEWEQVVKDINDGKSKLQLEVFYYEDFLHNPRENLARLNHFLGFNRSVEYMERVLQETSIASLKRYYQENADKLNSKFCVNDEGISVIFRKGQVGEWKRYFTVAQSEIVDKLIQESIVHGLFKFKV